VSEHNGPAPAGALTHYVSVSCEHNSRGVTTTAKASAWYTQFPDEEDDDAQQALAVAEAGSVRVASLAVHALRHMIDQGSSDNDIDRFIALVNRVGATILGGDVADG